MILSASRRTDIPCYYSDWLINRLKAGYVLTRNPMNHTQVSRITLSPDTVDCIVFWTKDPANMLDKLPVIDEMGYKYYFQFTLTPYGKDIEHNLRNKTDIINTFKILSSMIGKDRVLWRYDPIILNDTLTIQYHQNMFETLCSNLRTYTNLCTISFIDLYTKINGAISNGSVREITESEMHQLAEIYAAAGRKYGIETRACSEKTDLSEYGIKPASCIDRETIKKACGYLVNVKKDNNQRPGCNCIQSVDIGVYNTCKNGCIYCYANYSNDAVKRNYARHDSSSEILIGTVTPDEKVIERKAESFRNDQIKLV